MDDDEINIVLSDILTDFTITTSPQNGDIVIDTTTLDTKVYTTDTSWVDINDIITDTIDLSNITVNNPVEFEDTMPSVAKIEDMCNDYPGLRKAYENFKAVYKMVHQDWQGKQNADLDWPF